MDNKHSLRETITCFQLQHLLQTEPMNLLIIDCREACELFEESHIISAIHFPSIGMEEEEQTLTPRFIEQFLISFEDRILFRQREFVKYVVLYDHYFELEENDGRNVNLNYNEELCEADGHGHMYRMYRALKKEASAKNIVFLEGGFYKFRMNYPLFCEPLSMEHQHYMQMQCDTEEESECIINSSMNASFEQEKVEEEEEIEEQNLTMGRKKEQNRWDKLIRFKENKKQKLILTSSLIHKMSKEERLKIAHQRLFSSLTNKITCEEPSKLLPFLYLGSAQNSFNLEQLLMLNISCIVNMAIEVDNFYPEHFDYCKCDLMDNEFSDVSTYFEETYQFIEKARKNRRKILVACFMGMSRSASISIAYLMRAKKWSMKKAYKYVKKKRPIIDINNAFMRQLMQFEYSLFGKSSFPASIFHPLSTLIPSNMLLPNGNNNNCPIDTMDYCHHHHHTNNNNNNNCPIPSFKQQQTESNDTTEQEKVR